MLIVNATAVRNYYTLDIPLKVWKVINAGSQDINLTEAILSFFTYGLLILSKFLLSI